MANNKDNSPYITVNEGPFKVIGCKAWAQGKVRKDPVEVKVVMNADTECMGSGFVPEKSEPAVICLPETTCEPSIVYQPQTAYCYEPATVCKRKNSDLANPSEAVTECKHATSYEMVSQPETTIDGPATLSKLVPICEPEILCKPMTADKGPVTAEPLAMTLTDESEHVTAETEQMTAEPVPVIGEQEPVTANPELMISEPEPMTNKPEPVIAKPDPLTAKPEDSPSDGSEMAMNDTSGKRKAITEDAEKANVKRMATTEDAYKTNPEAADNATADSASMTTAEEVAKVTADKDSDCGGQC